MPSTIVATPGLGVGVLVRMRWSHGSKRDGSRSVRSSNQDVINEPGRRLLPDGRSRGSAPRSPCIGRPPCAPGSRSFVVALLRLADQLFLHPSLHTRGNGPEWTDHQSESVRGSLTVQSGHSSNRRRGVWPRHSAVSGPPSPWRSCVKGDSAPSRVPCGGGRSPSRSDLAAAAGVRSVDHSHLESGEADRLTIGTIRRCVDPLGMRVEVRATSRGPELDRQLDEDHARLEAGWTRRLTQWGWGTWPSELQPLWERGRTTSSAGTLPRASADHRVQDRPRRRPGTLGTSSEGRGWLARWPASWICRRRGGRPVLIFRGEHDQPPVTLQRSILFLSVRLCREAVRSPGFADRRPHPHPGC